MVPGKPALNGVSAPTATGYFQILKDTLIGHFVESYRKRPKRRVLHAPKFYFFDLGLVNFLLKRGQIQPGSEAFGKVFEHFIFQELMAHSHYSGKNYEIRYWRTTSQLEADFILGEHEVAVEVKGTKITNSRQAQGLKAFMEEYKPKKSIIISCDENPRLLSGNITVLPWRDFLEKLWAGEII